MSQVQILFYCQESFSLFDGGEQGLRSGGAGMKVFHAANELAKDERLKVAFLFPPDQAKLLSHPRIDFLPLPEFQLGGGLLTRRRNAYRLRHVRLDDMPAVMISTMDEYVPSFSALATALKAKSIYWMASDRDIVNPVCRGSLSKEDVIAMIVACDGVISQTQSQRQKLLETQGRESVVVANGWPMPEDTLGLEEREYVLWVGAAKAHKQPDYFIRLAAEFPEQNFVMLAPPTQERERDSEFYRELSYKASQLENLRLIDVAVPLKSVDEYYRKAKIFVNTSLYEGFPNTFIQAMSAATPLLSLRVNPDEFITRNSLGFCAEDNFEQLVKQLGLLLEDKAQWKNASSKARSYAMKHHDIAKTVADIKSVITSVAT